MIFLEYHSSHPLKFSVPISLLFVCNNNHLLHLLLFVHIHLDLSFTLHVCACHVTVLTQLAL